MAEVKLFDINLEDYKNRLQQIREELSQLTAGTDDYNRKQQELVDTTNELNDAIAASNPSMSELKNSLKELKDDWANANSEAERGAIAEQIGIVENQMKSMTQELRNTAQEASAAEGSYNSLVVQLRELQQQAKATGDASERMELSQKANEINNQLKEMDAQMGNYQRNVGDYANGVSSAFTTIVGGLQGVTGGTAKLAGAMNKLTPGLGAGAGALKALSKALGAIKMGSWVTALVAAGVAVFNWVKSIKEAEAEHKAFISSLTDIQDKSAEYAAKETVNAKVLFDAAMRAASGSNEYKNAIIALQKQYPTYFSNLSTESKNVRILQGDYNRLAADIQRAAKARAMEDLLADNYKELFKLEQQEIDLRNKINSPQYDAFRWGDLIGLERKEQTELNKNLQQAAEYRKANAKLEKELADNQVDVHQKEEKITGAVSKRSGAVKKEVSEEEKRKQILDEIEKKYAKIYKTIEQQEQTNEVINKNELNYYNNQLFYANQRRNAQLKELGEKLQRGLITEQDFKTEAYDIWLQWQKIANTVDEANKSIQDLAKGPNNIAKVFEVPEDTKKNIKEMVADLQKATGRDGKPDKNKPDQLYGIQQTVDSIGQLTSTISDFWAQSTEAQLQAGEITQEQAEEQFEKIKAFEIAAAVTSTIAGAIHSQMSVWRDPSLPLWSKIAMSVALGAETLMSGYAQIEKIKQTNIGSAGSSSAMVVANATPLLNEAQDINQLNGLAAVGEVTQGDQRVYILQSDIVNTTNQNKVRIEQSTF